LLDVLCVLLLLDLLPDSLGHSLGGGLLDLLGQFNPHLVLEVSLDFLLDLSLYSPLGLLHDLGGRVDHEVTQHFLLGG
jgi:hypothetical protein